MYINAFKKSLNACVCAVAIWLSLFIAGCSYDDIKELIDNTPELSQNMVSENASVDNNKNVSENTVSGNEGALVIGTEESYEYETEGMRRFLYSTLGEDEKQLYRDIYSILNSQAEKVKLSSLDSDLVDAVFACVMNDHPEFFYVTGFSLDTYSVNGKKTELIFSGTYNRSIYETNEDKDFVEAFATRFFENMPEFEGEYELARYIYTYIVENTEYDLDAPDNQNIISVFKNGKSVCQGYARATQYLLNKAGIQCLMVTGTAKGGPHAWNVACIDGVWTNIDTTWGDASYRDISTGNTWNEIAYDYFCISDDEISQTHTAKNKSKLPEAERIDG